jgi:hypothetical protein
MAADFDGDLPRRWEVNANRNDLQLHVILLVLAVAALGLSAILQVEGGTSVVVPLVQVQLPEMCQLRRTLGLPCPGCGLTRSFISLAHGDLSAAVQFNPAGPMLFALLAFQIPYRSWQIARLRAGKNEWSLGAWSYLPLWLIFAVLLGQWVFRLLLG